MPISKKSIIRAFVFLLNSFSLSFFRKKFFFLAPATGKKQSINFCKKCLKFINKEVQMNHFSKCNTVYRKLLCQMQMQFDTLEIWPFYRYNKQIEIWRLMTYSRTRLYRTARDRPFLWVITRIYKKRVNLCTKMTHYFKTLFIFSRKTISWSFQYWFIRL